MPRTKEEIQAEATKVFDKAKRVIDEAVADGKRLKDELQAVDPDATIMALRPSANDVTF